MHYILDNNMKIVHEEDLLKWKKWMENPENTQIAITKFKEPHQNVTISTVFLGVDVNSDIESCLDLPLVFETMVLTGSNKLYEERCHTYNEALEMHETMVKRMEKWLKR